MSHRSPLPVHASLYLHPDYYEDVWANQSSNNTPAAKVNYMLSIFGTVVHSQLDKAFPKWRSEIGEDSRPILTMYTYRIIGPCAEALRCGPKSGHDHNLLYYPVIVAYLLGLFRWIVDDDMFPQNTAEMLLTYFEYEYLDVGDPPVHPGTRYPNRRTFADINRIVMAFFPLIKRYVMGTLYSDTRSMESASSRVAIYLEAVAVASQFGVPYDAYRDYI
jgi:hypothetical protein